MGSLITLNREQNGHVAWLILNDPPTRNAMSDAMAEQFHRTVTELRSDPHVRVLVVTGESGAFSAGGHLDMLFEKIKLNANDNRRSMLEFYARFLSFRELEVPVIAAINGHAIGAALGVALACDLRIAVENAKVGLNFVKLGLHPGMATTYFLERIVGPAVAAELMFTGRILTAPEAHALGLINRVVPEAQFADVVRAIANEIAEAGPETIKQLKLSMRMSERQTLSETLRREAECQALSYASREFAEGLAAAREKRKPNFP